MGVPCNHRVSIGTSCSRHVECHLKWIRMTILAGSSHFGKNSEIDLEILALCQAPDGFVNSEAEETVVELG